MKKIWMILIALVMIFGTTPQTEAASKHAPTPKYEETLSGKSGGQYSAFPIPLQKLNTEEKALGIDTVWGKIKYRAAQDPFNVVATVIFILAIIHTFLTSKFATISHNLEARHEAKMKKKGILIERPEGQYPISFLSSVFHFLGEVEAVFGIWVIPLMLAAYKYHSFEDFRLYVDHDCVFTEPLFVTIVMIIAASRPIFIFAEKILSNVAKLGRYTPASWWITVMCLAPLLGSLITEPAAMTISAMILGRRFYDLAPRPLLAYATLGLLFVNISIGGTFTQFAAPPVIMIADKWDWNLAFMFTHFGWKAGAAIITSTFLYYFFFRKDFKQLNEVETQRAAAKNQQLKGETRKGKIPFWVTAVHLVFLVWTVVFSHVPILFIGSFVFFLGFLIATPEHQNHVILRIPIMVGFFLAGLVVLGGVQAWWLEPILTSLSSQYVMLGATVLTAFNDNAAVTYLASTVPDLSESVKYAVVAGAVTGGGLTVIANAPNPAGQAMLGKYFIGISPIFLFLAAIIPTTIVYIAFTYLVTL